MNQLSSAFTLFLSLLVEAIPFLLLGVMLSGLMLLFVSERKLISVMPKHPFLGALAGSLIGFLFPVCECGNVPVARRLLMQGAPAPVAIGFLLAAPTINPIVIWATWTAFRDQPEIVVLRVVLSLAIATLIVGYLALKLICALCCNQRSPAICPVIWTRQSLYRHLYAREHSFWVSQIKIYSRSLRF
jgi:uncharacterized protein